MFRQKRILQCIVAICGLVPISAGLSGILIGPHFVEPSHISLISLDSHFRYLSGLLLGIGLLFWQTIPNIELKGQQFRLLTMIILIGGLGRLWALFSMGVPNRPMLFGLGMELVVTPALALWQSRIAKVPLVD